MPIIYSALVPHSPVLLPSIGKELASLVSQTTQSLKKIYHKLEKNPPECIVILHSHTLNQKLKDTLYLQLPTIYKTSYKDFGDLETQEEYTPDIVLASELKNEMSEDSISLTYISDEKMEYPSSVPLHGIVNQNSQIKILVLHIPETYDSSLSRYGSILQRTLQRSSKRIALFATGNLSALLHSDTPEDIRHQAQKFDEDWVVYFRNSKKKKTPLLSQELSKKMAVCGLPAFLTLLAIVQSMNYRTHFYSYENNAGVGHIVCEYTF